MGWLSPKAFGLPDFVGVVEHLANSGRNPRLLPVV
jgi:hypothetical protein